VESKMPGYRLYLLDGVGHIRGFAELECLDDEHAVAVAEERGVHATMELWEGARLVRRFEPPDHHPET